MARRPRVGFLAIVLTVFMLFFFMARPGVGSAAIDRIKKTADAIYEDDWNRPGADAVEAESLLREADKLGHPSEQKPQEIAAKPVEPAKPAAHDTGAQLEKLLTGKPISSKMQNQTARAELGRAAWRFLHTVLAQYPEEATQDDRDTLINFLHLFSRVYPCRECAEHFQIYLAKYPPQVSTRQSAMMWGCDLHNKVNVRLGKPVFDCAFINEMYDCGCADGPEDPNEHKGMPEMPKVESGPLVEG